MLFEAGPEAGDLFARFSALVTLWASCVQMLTEEYECSSRCKPIRLLTNASPKVVLFSPPNRPIGLKVQFLVSTTRKVEEYSETFTARGDVLVCVLNCISNSEVRPVYMIIESISARGAANPWSGRRRRVYLLCRAARYEYR